MGKAMMYIASVFAQLERETIAERVRDNMLMLARTGRWLVLFFARHQTDIAESRLLHSGQRCTRLLHSSKL